MRQFRIFDDAAREGALAPVLSGDLFREAAIAGYEQGRRIGKWIFKRARTFIGDDARSSPRGGSSEAETRSSFP